MKVIQIIDSKSFNGKADVITGQVKTNYRGSVIIEGIQRFVVPFFAQHDVKVGDSVNLEIIFSENLKLDDNGKLKSFFISPSANGSGTTQK